jgi:hypothetical protein
VITSITGSRVLDIFDPLEKIASLLLPFVALGVLVYWTAMRFARRRRFFAAGIGAFVVFNGVALVLAYRYHQSLVEYCEPENRATGGSGLDCLEPSNWWFIDALALAWLVVAAALAAVVVVAYRRRRASTRSAPREVA